MFRLGIDLGGTKIEGILIAAGGTELRRCRIDTPRGDYQKILHAIRDLMHELEAAAGETCSVGIGTPGSLNPQGMLRNSNTIELNGRPFLQDIQAVCAREVRISNDANCFALSEATDGAAAGAHNVFGVILGTGVGGGIVINGQLLTGHNAVGGEWGHNPLPWPNAEELPGPECYCGKHGCIETFLSGPGLSRRYYQTTGEQQTPQEIVAAAKAGDRQAEQTLQDYEDQLARALSHVINIVDPEVIVLGGGLSNIERFYTNVPRRWGRYVFSDVVSTTLVPPQYGDSSGVRGAAWLW